MTIEDIAERSNAWRESIELIVKNLKAIGALIVGLIVAAIAFWPSSGENVPPPPDKPAPCVALFNTLNANAISNWTESEWGVFESAKRSLECD
jgi:hypothetical protein